MKNLLFITYLISFLLITNYSFAQCPDDPNVTLHTQTDVNNFLEQYPNCTELNNLGFESGDEGDIINDISGFSSLQNLTGRLNIYYTDLTQLTGLNNLEHIYGGLDIYGNNNLGSLLELQTLIDVQEFITINDNPSLPECEAEGICNSLDNVETGFGGNQAGCNSLEEVQEQCSASNCDEFYADADVIPTCYGECTGQITITAGGGTEPYYYDWGDGQTEDNSQSGLCEGTYSITVSDDAGCSTVVENEVTENPELTVTINVSQDIQCNGDCDGSLTANASGGTSPYSYAWEGGEAITQTISNLCAGTFTVTATDDIGCTATAEYTLTEPDELVLSETHINVSCNGYSDGSIDLTVTGGAIGEFAYSYQWSNDETTEDIYDLAAGTYSVTVTDNNGCEKYLSVEITQPDELVLSETHINVTCNGDNDGSIDLTVIGGTPDYSYSWSNGETTEDIYNLAPDTYTVTVTDDNDCTATLSVTITEPDAINLTESHNNVTCNGDNDGSIDLTVTGGTSDYSYSWSSGETTEDISDLAPDTYTVTVTDDNDCTATLSVTITEPDAINLTESHNNVTCNGDNDGSIDLTVTGGTPDYSYSWSSGETTQDISDLAPDTYTVTVTDNNGCTATLSVTITEPDAIGLTESHNNVTCNGDNDGSIDLTVTGGTPDYSYSWSNGETTEDISGLAPDTYTVTVTDDNDCTATLSITITEPDELFANASATDETANDAEDGTATANPSGGPTPYNFEWNTGETNQTITDLAPGDYDVTVTDANGCTAEETVTVAEFICPTLTIESTQTDASCFEACDGEITITNVINGIAPYAYAWSDGQTTQTATGLCVGDYDLTVTDSKNCSVVSETFVITEPEELTATTTATGETYNNANNGTTTVNADGGTPPYDYEWDTGETTQTITDLAPAIYYVTVTDDNGCTVEASAEVEEFICPTLTIFEETENVYCNGDCDGYVTIYSIENGVAPFEYLWNTGDTESSINNLCPGTYSVTVTDADNCQISKTYEITEPDELLANAAATNETAYGAQDGTAIANPIGGTTPYEYDWSTGATSQSIVNLAPGDYIVTVTDYFDCTSIETVTVQEYICPELTVNAIKTDVNCYNACDGEIEITSVENAVQPLDYKWSNGETTAIISNLCPGEYTVTITDDKNCEIIESYTITQPAELLANATATDETYNDADDGTASANPTGGESPYTFAWSNGESIQTITGLAPGSYTVTVTDSNDCTSIESVSVAEFGCQGLAIEISHADVKCNGECNGILEITGVTNGATPFTYTWSNGKTTAKIDSLCPENYSVTVVDGNNCNVYGSYAITEPSELFANATSTNETANGANDGTATSNPSGGTQPYTYYWSNGQNTQSISGLNPGDYQLTATDANECTAFDTISIVKFTCPNLVVNSQLSNVSCFGACDGAIAVLSVNNAVSPLTYSWNTGINSASLSNLCAGDYSVTITDAKNCEVIQNYTLTQPDQITITIDSTRDVRLDPLGYIYVTTNNTGNYIFDWSGPGNFTANNEDLDNLKDFGCYILTVTDTTTNCSIDSTICLLDKTATFDLDQQLGISIFPNPANNELYFNYNKEYAKAKNIYINIFSGSGIVVKSNVQLNDKINIADLDEGIYFVQIKSIKGFIFKKLVIVR